VFIKSSSFTADARIYVQGLRHKTIVLIDGALLAELMIDRCVGVTTVRTLEIKRVDSDYFIVE
jgi:restriction system protein